MNFSIFFSMELFFFVFYFFYFFFIYKGAFLFGAVIPCCTNQQWPLYEYCSDHHTQWGKDDEEEEEMTTANFHTDGIEFLQLERHPNRCLRPCMTCYRTIVQQKQLIVGRYDKYAHVKHWLMILGETQDLLLECTFIQKEFLPLERLDLMLVSLRQCWLKALTRNHLLQHALRNHFVRNFFFFVLFFFFFLTMD